MKPRAQLPDYMRSSRRTGFTLIELLIVVVIIGILAAIAIPKFSSTKEKAYLSKMKSDLRNLATAQESYISGNFVYYGGVLPNAALTYNPSAGVTIVIPVASAAGWSAVATMPGLTTKSCALYIGGVPPVAPATAEGQVTCT